MKGSQVRRKKKSVSPQKKQVVHNEERSVATPMSGRSTTNVYEMNQIALTMVSKLQNQVVKPRGLIDRLCTCMFDLVSSKNLTLSLLISTLKKELENICNVQTCYIYKFQNGILQTQQSAIRLADCDFVIQDIIKRKVAVVANCVKRDLDLITALRKALNNRDIMNAAVVPV